MKKFKLWTAKRDLKKKYLRFRAIGDELDCGDTMASYISHRYIDAKDAVNSAIVRVNQLDKSAQIPILK